MANICIIGLWHQGSILCACLSDIGHRVWGIDRDATIVQSLSAGEPVVREPKLKAMIKRNLKRGHLSFSSDYAKGLKDVSFVFISIDTPVGEDDRADLKTVFEVARKIAKNISGKACVVVTAQVPVGTCEQIADVIRAENPKAEFDIACVPEFLRLGTAIETFKKADRFVIGADDVQVAERVAELYRPLKRPVVITNLRSAEMGKHASNTFLALSISFINELADLCDEVGADASDVAKIMKLDRRIGKYAFLSPGLGFAGGTLGRDVRAIQAFGKEFDLPTRVMDAIMAVNETRVELVKYRLLKIYDHLNDLQVGIWGLTYKPGTSTLRRSLALSIIQLLTKQGVQMKAFDPLAKLDEVRHLPPFQVCEDPYQVAQNSDAIVLVTEWADIRSVDLIKVRKLMKQPVFIDTRNLFDPVDMQQKGFIYSGIGRGISTKTTS